MNGLPHTTETLRFGPFELDVRSRELRKGKTRVRLQEQPFEILRMMLERPGDVVTREELCSRLWPNGTFVDFEHSLNAAVKRLRAALGDEADNPRFVETLPRRGYRLIAGLDDTEPPVGDAAPPPGSRVRLAVLPFRIVGDDSGQDYFADGLTEEMIAQLGPLCRGRIGVIARSSSMAFKRSTHTAREIGQTLRPIICSRAACGRKVTACGLPRGWSKRRARRISGLKPTSAISPIASRCRPTWRRASHGRSRWN